MTIKTNQLLETHSKNAIQRINKILTTIHVNGREPVFRKKNVQSTDGSLSNSPTQNCMAASAIFETKQENVYVKLLKENKKNSSTEKSLKRELKIETTAYSSNVLNSLGSSFRGDLWGILIATAVIPPKMSITIHTDSESIVKSYKVQLDPKITPCKHLRRNCPVEWCLLKTKTQKYDKKLTV
jgi:hypothetical protein